MKIIDSFLRKDIIATHQTTYGSFYVFEHFVASEIKEGVRIDTDKSLFLFNLITHYSKNKPINYLSHQLYSYDIALDEFQTIMQLYPKVTKCAIVTYTEEIRKKAMASLTYYNCLSTLFDNLSEANSWLSPQKIAPNQELFNLE